MFTATCLRTCIHHWKIEIYIFASFFGVPYTEIVSWRAFIGYGAIFDRFGDWCSWVVEARWGGKCFESAEISETVSCWPKRFRFAQSFLSRSFANHHIKALDTNAVWCVFNAFEGYWLVLGTVWCQGKVDREAYLVKWIPRSVQVQCGPLHDQRLLDRRFPCQEHGSLGMVLNCNILHYNAW